MEPKMGTGEAEVCQPAAKEIIKRSLEELIFEPTLGTEVSPRMTLVFLTRGCDQRVVLVLKIPQMWANHKSAFRPDGSSLIQSASFVFSFSICRPLFVFSCTHFLL